MKRPLLTAFAATQFAFAFAVYCADTQHYPSHPIRLIVHTTPGGGGDTIGRIVGLKLSENMGQPVVIDNRPGGGSTIASGIVAKSPPNGYTMYLISPTFTIMPAMQKNLPFDPLKDFSPISRVSITPAVLVVHSSLGVRSVQKLVQLAKSKPRQVSFGSAGIASPSHLAGELFSSLARIQMLHVPFKGSAQVTTGLLSGEVAVAIINPVSAVGPVKAGILKILAVTSATRSPSMPDVPTIAESGVPGYESIIWNGILLPAGASRSIITRLHNELAKITAESDVIERLAVDGSQPMIESPQEFGDFLKMDLDKWANLIKTRRIGEN